MSFLSETASSFGVSRLQCALQARQPARVVQGIVKSHPESLRRPDFCGMLPLHYAIYFNSPLEVIELLIREYPDALETHDYGGFVPLHYAASEHRPEDVVRLLVEACPRTLLAKNNEGRHPLDVLPLLRRSSPVATYLKNAMAEFRHHTNAATVPVIQQQQPSSSSPPLSTALLATSPIEIDLDDHVPVGPSPPLPSQRQGLHNNDRKRVREAVESPHDHPPALVSVSYVHSIKTLTFLGDGFFGTVHKGSDHVLGLEFAIKSINTEILRGGTPQELQAAMRTFQTEQAALSRFRHPNIAALFAYTDPLAEGNNNAASGYHLVYELAEKGSLDRYLQDDLGRSRLGSFQRRVQVAIDVMSALQFLHKGNDQFHTCFHRDVKSANVVLKRDFTAQLIDCGLAQFVNDDIRTTGIKGTKGYICPQYVQTGKYSSACDIYSFGVVLLELWTGQMQNHKDDKSGKEFNFGEEYIHEGKDVKGDADAAMDLTSPLPGCAARFADLAFQCINERTKNRPSGDDVLEVLQSILDECAPPSHRRRLGDNAVDENAVANTRRCSTCRTFMCAPMHSTCALCLCREEIRNGFSAIASNSMRQPFDALAMEDLSNRIVQDLGPKLNAMSDKLDGVAGMAGATHPVLAHLDRRLNNQVPRTFVLLPADILNGWKHPRSWLRSNVQKKYYLFFVCPVSQQVVSSPIKLKVEKDWFRKAAPVLASGLFLLQVGLKAGLNINLDLDGTTSALFDVKSEHIGEMLEELSEILKEERGGDDGLLARLRSGDGSSCALSNEDIRELSGDAYELVIEKAGEQDGWRSKMEPVWLPPSPKVFWVAKSIAHDPKYGYEIVKA